jgi:hypothetical protein
LVALDRSGEARRDLDRASALGRFEWSALTRAIDLPLDADLRRV